MGKPKLTKLCQSCNTSFVVLDCHRKRIYCSKTCGLIGSWKDKKRRPKFGKILSEETKFKISNTLKNKHRLHQNWKSDIVGYTALHQWMYSHYGKANICENIDGLITGKPCSQKSVKFDWAKKKGFKYSRSRDSWYHLCRSCHSIYDKN